MNPSPTFEKTLSALKRIIPKPLFELLRPAYHSALALIAALYYGFPSRELFVVAVTGTKGKSTVCELINAILEEAGFETALSSTIRIKVGKSSEPNLYKMTLPGRTYMQKFLARAADAGAEYAIVEITSEAAAQFRHKYVELDALVFTNLSPEHIESHGSYEKYRDAKLSIGRALEKSKKKETFIIVNAEDREAPHFLNLRVKNKIQYSLRDIVPYNSDDMGGTLTLGEFSVHSPLPGIFNIYNILAAAAFARSRGIDDKTIKRGIENVQVVPGRMERIHVRNFDVIVDYAHTADSLRKVYEAFKNKKKICILGAAGGGRDSWKRKVMGQIADEYCEKIILTNEDPYDEDPQKILADIQTGITKKTPAVIMDRRTAIREGINAASSGYVVLVTGKGTDPYIMGAHGGKTPWSDKKIVEEALAAINAKRE
ncbi:UDP-N-acetylmuramoyl-L-alanyl-D-glutamate--2,6-diaminopimelate ligase [bacterium]|nr:UDP-N-acetylmuramoyl-L-alanyl-D-glutamate--2,6-diaminopimelate ligase [bacterium]